MNATQIRDILRGRTPAVRPVPFADVTLYVRELSTADTPAWVALQRSNKDLSETERAKRLTSLFLCDEGGTPIIQAEDDYKLLDSLPLLWVDKIVSEGLTLNAIGNTDDAKKN